MAFVAAIIEKINILFKCLMKNLQVRSLHIMRLSEAAYIQKERRDYYSSSSPFFDLRNALVRTLHA